MLSLVIGQGRMTALAPAKVVAKLKGQSALAATLHLRSGRDVTGFIVEVNEPSGAVLVRTPKSRAGDFSLSWVELASLEAVTVPDGTAAATAPSSPLGEPLPPATRLDVDRRAAELSKALSVPVEASLKSVAEDGAARRVVLDALDACAQALKDIGADEVGRAELKKALKSIRVAEAGRARAQLTGGTLFIEVASARGEHPGTEAIKAVLESSL